jgi:hypothetical protein
VFDGPETARAVVCGDRARKAALIWIAALVAAADVASSVPELSYRLAALRPRAGSRRPSCTPPSWPLPNVRRVKREMRLGAPRAQQVQSYLEALSPSRGDDH